MNRVTLVFIPGDVDVQSGLEVLRAIDDRQLLELGHLGLLGWGWEIPFVESPEPSWGDDHELKDAELSGIIPPEMQERYLAAVRESLGVAMRNAAILLSGEHSWFESFLAHRIPLASGGQMLAFSEGDLASEQTSLSDVARLPIEVLPQVGRAMGVLGPEAVAIHITATDGH